MNSADVFYLRESDKRRRAGGRRHPVAGVGGGEEAGTSGQATQAAPGLSNSARPRVLNPVRARGLNGVRRRGVVLWSGGDAQQGVDRSETEREKTRSRLTWILGTGPGEQCSTCVQQYAVGMQLPV